jgi:hypothetical protein
VVQQCEGTTSMRESLTIGPTQDRYEEEPDRAVTRENAPAGRAMISLWNGADEKSPDLAQFMPHLKSGLSLQRQLCNKADDRAVTGPLTAQLPEINCEPSPVALEQIRNVPDPHNRPGNTGITQPHIRGPIDVDFEELPLGKCKATVRQYWEMEIKRSMYAEAGDYEDGTEVTPADRACKNLSPDESGLSPDQQAYRLKKRCPEGRTVKRRSKITKQGADKVKLAEIEHCEDHKLAFALSMSKYNQAVRDLQGEYCAAEPSWRDKPPPGNQLICKPEFEKRFKTRTGIEYKDTDTIVACLWDKSDIRDSEPRHWHTLIASDCFYAPDCGTVTYLYNQDSLPNVGNHPSSEIVKGCGEK